MRNGSANKPRIKACLRITPISRKRSPDCAGLTVRVEIGRKAA
jgi:hypothetical protein